MTPDDAAVRPIRHVIGEGVRRLRDEAGVRQEDLAQLAGALFGLPWSRSRIAAIERGDKAISAEDLVVLVHLMSAAQVCDRPVSVAELLGGPSPALIRIAPAAALPTTAVAAALSSPRGDAPVPTKSPVPSDAVRAMSQPRDPFRGLNGAAPLDLGLAAVVASRHEEADYKAAARLGKPVEEISAACRRLWGRSLAAQRDSLVAEQAEPDASARRLQALRGVVTRGLLAEIAAEIARTADVSEIPPEVGSSAADSGPGQDVEGD